MFYFINPNFLLLFFFQEEEEVQEARQKIGPLLHFKVVEVEEEEEVEAGVVVVVVGRARGENQHAVSAMRKVMYLLSTQDGRRSQSKKVANHSIMFYTCYPATQNHYKITR